MGKSTLSRALMRRFEHGLHIEVDVLREWVVSGIAHPMDWTDETVRQFRLAEQAAVDLAIRYQDAGFAVAIDHCRRLEDWDEVLTPRLEGRPLVKVVLTCALDLNLRRNRERTTKDFEPEILEKVIHDLAVRLPESQAERPDWRLVANEGETVEAVVDKILALGP